MDFLTVIIVLILLILIIIIFPCVRAINKMSQGCQIYNPEFITVIDLNKYQGLWYEVARLPNPFQNGCKNTTALYTLNKNGTLNIKNQCKINGKDINVNGTAYANYPSRSITNQIGNFKVYFENNPFAGEYNVIYVDANYQYAMVGTNNRKYLWLLSRTKNVDDEQKEFMLKIAKNYGFNIDNLIFGINNISA